MWHFPLPNEAQPTLADLLHRRQWNASIPKGQQPCCHGELCADVPCQDGLGVHTELFSQVERTFQAGQLGNIAKRRGRFHVHRTVPSFDQPNQIFVQQALLVFVRYLRKARFTANQALEGIFGEHAVHAGQTQRNTGHHVGIGVTAMSSCRGNRGGGTDRSRCVDQTGPRHPTCWSLLDPSNQIVSGDGGVGIHRSVHRRLRAQRCNDALHVGGRQAQPRLEVNIAVAKGGRVAAEDGDAIADIGLNRLVLEERVVRCRPANNGCGHGGRGHRSRAARGKRSSTRQQRFPFC